MREQKTKRQHAKQKTSQSKTNQKSKSQYQSMTDAQVWALVEDRYYFEKDY